MHAVQKLRAYNRRLRQYTYFTLLELIIVIAIIAVIAAIALPPLFESKCRAKIAALLADLNTLNTNITGGLIKPDEALQTFKDLMDKYVKEIKLLKCFSETDKAAIIKKLEDIKKEVELKTTSAPDEEISGWKSLLDKIKEKLGLEK